MPWFGGNQGLTLFSLPTMFIAFIDIEPTP